MTKPRGASAVSKALNAGRVRPLTVLVCMVVTPDSTIHLFNSTLD